MGNPQPPYLVYSLWVLLECITVCPQALLHLSPMSLQSLQIGRTHIFLLNMAFDISKIPCPFYFRNPC